MTNRNIIMLAALGIVTAALAPTSASALGRHGFGASHPAKVAVSHPARTVRPAVRFNLRISPVFHAPTHAWHRPVYRPIAVASPVRPSWHRPVLVERPIVSAYQAPVRIAAAPPVLAKRPIAQAAQVTGLNVTVIDIPNGEYRMTAQGQWEKQQSDGKTFKFTEDKRDEASVYLTDASRGVSLQLDVSQKKVYLLGASAKKPVFPILNASADIK